MTVFTTPIESALFRCPKCGTTREWGADREMRCHMHGSEGVQMQKWLLATEVAEEIRLRAETIAAVDDLACDQAERLEAAIQALLRAETALRGHPEADDAHHAIHHARGECCHGLPKGDCPRCEEDAQQGRSILENDAIQAEWKP